MSHQPPVPPAATPPYPAHPDPLPERDLHDEAHSEAGERAAEAPAAAERSTLVGVGAAVGIGSAALLAALLYSRRSSASARRLKETEGRK